jgi:dTDP-4-dehydrorhamnose 3,5-epimerase
LKFQPLALRGAWLIEPEFHLDRRGSFCRTFCIEEFAAQGLDGAIEQCSLSHNCKRGTLRGIHFQSEPLAETKLVRVPRGAVWDVIVDLRRSSATFGRWLAAELSSTNAHAMYVPQGFGHAFVTLMDDTEVYYQMSARHVPSLARGLRWDDPTIAIDWPLQPLVISEKDASLPLLQQAVDSLYP